MAILLFDIDGTLVNKTPKHSLAFEKGIKKTYFLDPVWNFSKQGMTDSQIIIDSLKDNLDEKIILEKLDECIKSVADEYSQMTEDNLIILPGVVNLLEDLKKTDHKLGLVTGNIQRVGEHKLGQVNLWKYFSFGGFGDEDRIRYKLVDIALKKINYSASKEEVFIIGDTPGDIKAAKGAGVKCIAVATGKFSKEQLEKHNPNYILESLEEKEKFFEIIS
jgi:phosphoglycolate phosphatase